MVRNSKGIALIAHKNTDVVLLIFMKVGKIEIPAFYFDEIKAQGKNFTKILSSKDL